MSKIVGILKKGLRERCFLCGFKNNSGSWFLKPGITDDYMRMLRFRFATYSDARIIDVDIAVRNIRVEEIYERVTNSKLKVPLCIMGSSIGYITPKHQYIKWIVNEQTNYQSVYDEIFYYINEYADSYYEKYENVCALINYLSDRRNNVVGIEQQFKILPILHLMRGDKDAGIRVMDQLIKDGFDRRYDWDWYNKYYNNFCKFEL